VKSSPLKWTFLGVCVISLIGNAILPRDRTAGATVAEAIILSFIMFTWVVDDARRRNVQLSPLIKACVVAFGAIAVPVYLIKSRGFRVASRRVAFFVVQFMGCMMITLVLLVALQMAGMLKQP
jgi:hypothetical protein